MRKLPKPLFKHRPRPDASQASPTESDGLNDIRFIAVHEAGHAVSAIVLGFNLTSVDIKRRRLPNGRTSMGFTDTGRVAVNAVMGNGEDVALPHIAQCLTGPYAESLLNPGVLYHGAASEDMNSARRVAAVALCKATKSRNGMTTIAPEEIERNQDRIHALIMKGNDVAIRVVKDHWIAITQVAELLIERKQLSGAEVAAIVAECQVQTEGKGGGK